MVSILAESTPTLPMLMPLARTNHLYGVLGNSILGADVTARSLAMAVRAYLRSCGKMRVQPFWAVTRDDVRARIHEGLSRNSRPSESDIERFLSALPAQRLLMARYVWSARSAAGVGSLVVFPIGRGTFRVLELLGRSELFTSQ